MSEHYTDYFLNNVWIEKWNELVSNGMSEWEADVVAADWAMQEYERLAE